MYLRHFLFVLELGSIHESQKSIESALNPAIYHIYGFKSNFPVVFRPSRSV